MDTSDKNGEKVKEDRNNVIPGIDGGNDRRNENCIPTLKPDLMASPAKDSEMLMNSTSDLGYNEFGIFNILTHRNSSQREHIKYEFLRVYKINMVPKILKGLSDQLAYIAACLLHTGPDADAYIIWEAIKDPGNGESRVIHILCTRSNEQISQIKSSYLKMFGVSLDQHICSHSSGTLQKILTYLSNTLRCAVEPDQKLAEQQAFMIYSKSLISSLGSEQVRLIFCQSSYKHIRAISESFQKQFNIPLYSHIHKYHGNYEDVLKSIVLFSINPIAYYAMFLRQSLLKMSVKDVVCLVFTRAEIDLSSILSEYNSLFNSKAEMDIQTYLKCQSIMTTSAINMACGLE